MIKSNISIDLDEKIIEYIDNKLENRNILEYINNIVSLILDDQNVHSENIDISIQSASKEEIKKINKEYRGIDSSTDVLSFPIFERQELENIKNECDENKKIKEVELGDIILCLDVIEEHANEYKTGILREILYMITHAMFHLLGYDHIEEEDKKEMRALEEKILEKVGVIR
jgi:probable rRNA maturation factor